MRPFLGIDLTTNQKNNQLNGKEFLAATPSAALAQTWERCYEKAEETVSSAQLPLPIRIGQWICGMLGLIVTFGIVKALTGPDSVTLAQAYQNADYLFWVGGGCLLIWVILKLIAKRKEKVVMENEESIQTLSNLEGVGAAIYAELGVPADAKEVDILSFYYKDKDGKVVVCGKGMQITPYANSIFRVFSDSEKLYLANLEGKYAFPLSALGAVQTVKKHIRVPSWNKDQPCTEEPYKQYKLTTDDYGCIHCKYYHILEVRQGADTWGIYIPCYELPAFEAYFSQGAQ